MAGRTRDITFDGLDEAIRSLDKIADDLTGEAMQGGMRRAALVVEAGAKRKAPVDTGRLRSSITSAVTVTGFGARGVQGIVGTNVVYAPYMEFGTGTFAGRPRVKMPPPAALEGWARRHGGANPYLIARAIYRAGGLKKHEFFQGSMRDNEQRVVDIINETVAQIIARS